MYGAVQQRSRQIKSDNSGSVFYEMFRVATWTTTQVENELSAELYVRSDQADDLRGVSVIAMGVHLEVCIAKPVFKPFCQGLPALVIRFTSENRKGTKDLFQQSQTSQLVWQSQLGETPSEICDLEDAII